MKLRIVSSTIALLIIAGVDTYVEARSAPLKIIGGKRVLDNLGAVPGPRPNHASPNSVFGPIKHQAKKHLEPRKWKNSPDKTKKLCGPGVGTCDPGYCCSIGGHCGQGYHYCSGPACQLDYGDSCDANIMPLGEETLHIERPLIGNVTYDGAGIYNCLSDNHIALTFDDGPFNFTWHLLDVLASYNAKATFFVTGNNMGKGQIDIEETGYPEILRRMHRDGHQIASHTWTHEDLTTLNETQLINQMHYNEMAFRNILGFFPTYMRPPYSKCSEACQSAMKKLGYHVTYYSLITDDYKWDDPALIYHSKKIWDDAMQQFNNTDVHYISISHDIHYQTAYNLTNYMLDYMKWLDYGTSVTVGECLGDPKENWYRTAPGAPAPSLLLLKKTSGARRGLSLGANVMGSVLGIIWSLVFLA